MKTIHLSGRKLTTWQRCKRLHALETQYHYALWHPTTLFSAVMRRAIVELSSGAKPREQVETDAVSLLMTQARDPGLDAPAGMDTYRLAVDLCGTIRTLLAYLSRITLTPLYELPVLTREVGDGLAVQWSPLAHKDETGMLHRWVFTPHLRQDSVLVEAHKWETFGDLVVYDAPLMLHVVAIGETDGGRRHSAWCRAHKSPVVAGQIRFKKRKGQFTESWEPVYFGDNPRNDADRWVDAMVADEAHKGLLVHQALRQVEGAHKAGFYRDLGVIAKEIAGAHGGGADAGGGEGGAVLDPMQLPMSRPACDAPFVCQHQTLCYGTKGIEETGLYRLRS